MTIVLMVIFSVAMGYATFVENDFGTVAVRSLIYEAWWFELVMILLSINFIANIPRYKLWHPSKRPIFLFHIAFVVVIMGAFITRYFGQEGMMHIRENDRSNQIVSSERYLSIEVADGSKIKSFEKRLNASALKKPSVSKKYGKNNELSIETVDFIPDAVQTLVPGDDIVLEVVVSHEGQRRDLFLPNGKDISLPHGKLSFNGEEAAEISIRTTGDSLTIISSTPLSFLEMASQNAGRVPADTLSLLRVRSLYQAGDVSFVISQVHRDMKIQFIQAQDEEMAKSASDLLFVNCEIGDQKHEFQLAALDGVYSPPQNIELGDYQISINYGPKMIDLPFSLYLEDFQLERYPGSTSPSSYASEVVVEDGETKMPYRIYMNNVLDHGGYRFFQASYDMDELGTVLSVNQDYWGTRVTYVGYGLLFLCMIWTLFGKQSRFQIVMRNLQQLKVKEAAIIVLLFIGFQSKAEEVVIDSAHCIPKDHAALFGKLLVQDIDGRIKPLNTLSSEFTRKIYRSSTLKIPTQIGDKLNSEQVFLSVNADPYYWRDIPLIKVDPEKGELILQKLKKEGEQMISFADLLDEEGNYKLAEWAAASHNKKPSARNQLDKEIIKTDERFNVLFQALDGHYLKVFPKKNDDNNTWFNFHELDAFDGEDSLFVAHILPMYYQSLFDAHTSGDWTKAEQNLTYIKTYQNVIGESVIPSKGRQKAEVFYNQLNLFNRLIGFYWLLGVAAMILVIVKIFKDTKLVSSLLRASYWISVVFFALLTANLILRWYAGDYPPWSNGYEMLILVAWFLVLFGVIFHRASDFVLPLSCLFTGTLLFVSFLDWLNPEITNLVPVLKSYWLKIHVAVIVGSYAPLALSALLGLMALIIMLFPKMPQGKVKIAELTYINELSMTIGIFMLTIGTFLGGIWANESWGRYWGWDPKETWALISVIVYAVVLHLRLIPGMGTKFIFSVASLFAFYSIIMTSFGVNYYLSGLHSYAKGDAIPIPTFVYWVTGSLLIVTVLAYVQKQRFKVSY